MIVLEGLYVELLKAFLPSGVLDYFEITSFAKEDERITLHLQEKNELPVSHQGQPFHSKGFLPPVLIEDFPIRGNKVLLQIKRRRWEHTQSAEIITRDWKLVQKGTKMTAEFAAFLKQAFG